VYAAELSRLDGRIGADLVERTRAILTSVGLPTSYPRAAWPQLRDHMRLDKKNRGAKQRFVVLDGLAKVGRLEGPAEELLESAYQAIAG
jgi:3-dehydroquinate synthase